MILKRRKKPMRKWMIFRAEKRQPGWENRKLAHTGSLTKTLAEHLDSFDGDNEAYEHWLAAQTSKQQVEV
jgi:hypothetical protein